MLRFLLPRTTYRDTRTWIVSSSLDPGSLAERISSSLALCPPFDLASGQSSSPVFGQGFFLPWWGPSSAFQGQVDNLSLCPPHGWHVALRIADQTVKTYIGFVAGDAAPYPPPSDPRLATPDFGRILLPRPGSIRSGASPPPLRRTILRFGFGPIIGLQLRLEPLFFAPMTVEPCESAWQHFPLSVCVRTDRVRYFLSTRSAAFVAPLLQGQMLRHMTP